MGKTHYEIIFRISFRPWLLAYALELTLLPDGGWPQVTAENQPDQQKAATNATDKGTAQQNAAKEVVSGLKGIKRAIRDLIADEDNMAEEAAKNPERRDLDAQENMARWAFWTFVAKFLTVLLAAIPLVAIIRILYHTKRASESAAAMVLEASAATSAGEKTVAITRFLIRRFDGAISSQE